MASTIRSFMTLVETLHRRLDEAGAGPSRVLDHIHDGTVFFMLSAMRGSCKHAENLRRTRQLKQMLSRLPLQFIETTGEYHEDGQPTPLPERSFFVMPGPERRVPARRDASQRSAQPKPGRQTLTAATFRTFGLKLMAAFQQDSILFGDGRTASLIFADGSTADLGDTATFRPEIIDTLDGHSQIHGRKFSFTDASTAARPVKKPDSTEEPAKTKGVRYGGKSVLPAKTA